MGHAASDGWTGVPAEAEAQRSARARRGAAVMGLSWLGGVLATGVAIALAAVLAVVFAATLAVLVLLSSGLFALYALTHAKRRRPEGVLIEARRVGHSWVAYGWDQRPR